VPDVAKLNNYKYCGQSALMGRRRFERYAVKRGEDIAKENNYKFEKLVIYARPPFPQNTIDILGVCDLVLPQCSRLCRSLEK